MSAAVIELRDLQLKTDIGTYGPDDVKPDVHVLDLSLGIAVDQVLIALDGMAHVFDYDPLILEIDRLAADGHYETQERLITRIAAACAAHPAIRYMDLPEKVACALGQWITGRSPLAGRSRHRRTPVRSTPVAGLDAPP